MNMLSAALLDVVYWPIVQLSVSVVLIRVPSRVFASDNWMTRPRQFEQSLRLYRACGVHRWKKRLPDAARFVGGDSKRVNPYSLVDASRFMSDIRRAELAHWAQLACVIPCWLWNPAWASVVMTLYALSSNVPCILAQRYNRMLLQRREVVHGLRSHSLDGSGYRRRAL